MKIPFLNFEILPLSAVKNKNVSRPDSAKLLKQIKETQLTRTREDIDLWRAAMSTAESKLTPDRTALIRIFRDIVLDAHLSSLMSSIKFDILSSPFFVESAQGENDTEETAKFRKAWFRDFLSHAIDADFWGSSLVNFGSIKNDVFENSELVPREYVIPELRAVKKNLFITKIDLLYFDNPPFDLWTIFVHEPGSLGLLCKAAPLVIWKKNVLGAWSEAAELFGMPIRIGKTDINNPVNYANMVKMLREMGSASFGVFDNDDELQLIETSKTDYFEVYDKLVERVNSELSKLILGQTMTSDSGSSRSQAEVHERKEESFVLAQKMKIADLVNDKLIPLMQIHGIAKPGDVFKWDDEQRVSIEVRFKWAIELVKSGKYSISPEWFEQTFGIPVEEALVQEGAPEGEKDPESEESVMSDVENLYKLATEVHNH